MSARSYDFDVCVLGAGPAGCTLAIKLTQLGLSVALVERARFPRKHLGESLSPGVRPMLDSIGAGAVLERSGARPVHRVHVHWNEGAQIREDPSGRGLIVDRAKFDSELLKFAKAEGVTVFQPATLQSHWVEDRWMLQIEKSGRTPSVIPSQSRFLADASGRARALPGKKLVTGTPTIAVYAYWKGKGLPTEPRMEAGADAWFWGVPLPDGTYNTLAFVDRGYFRGAQRESLASRFQKLIRGSGLLGDSIAPKLQGSVRAVDASPYLEENPVTPHTIKVGDTALALDPISSSGVQKAIQSALSGAIVVNTILQKPSLQDAAIQFYRESLAGASLQHRHWAGEHYGSIFLERGGSFWKARSAPLRSQPTASGLDETDSLKTTPCDLMLSPELRIADVPCLGSEFVEIQKAAFHPKLKGPVAYVYEIPLAQLLLKFPPVIPSDQLAQWCSTLVPSTRVTGIVSWLRQSGLLVSAPTKRPPTA